MPLTRKMPSFPPDFDGAPLRHQLYTLALTHFQTVYTNYFERPELHKLHNRSGELWSPLVALAAFFEEQGGVVGLLEAISNAAEWDEQISKGLPAVATAPKAVWINPPIQAELP